MARQGVKGIWTSVAVVLLSTIFLGLQGSREAYEQGYRRACEGRTPERANLFYKFGYQRGQHERSESFPEVSPLVAPGPSSPNRG